MFWRLCNRLVSMVAICNIRKLKGQDFLRTCFLLNLVTNFHSDPEFWQKKLLQLAKKWKERKKMVRSAFVVLIIIQWKHVHQRRVRNHIKHLRRSFLGKQFFYFGRELRFKCLKGFWRSVCFTDMKGYS